MPPQRIAVPRRSQNSGASGLSGSKGTVRPEAAVLSSPAGRAQWSRPSEDLLVYPLQEGPIQLEQLLPRHVRQDGAALPFVHQIPHRGNGRLAPALVGHLGIIGYEVEFTATMAEPALLDFMIAHGKLAGCAWVRLSGGYGLGYSAAGRGANAAPGESNRGQPPPSTI
jgi:hypothetical protein